MRDQLQILIKDGRIKQPSIEAFRLLRACLLHNPITDLGDDHQGIDFSFEAGCPVAFIIDQRDPGAGVDHISNVA